MIKAHNPYVGIEVDEIFEVLGKTIGLPVINALRIRFPFRLYLRRIVATVEASSQSNSSVRLTDDASLLEHLTLHNWLSIMLDYSDVFDERFGPSGRKHLRLIRDIHMSWKDGVTISEGQFHQLAASVVFILRNLDCQQAVAQITTISPSPVSSASPTWLAIEEDTQPICVEGDFLKEQTQLTHGITEPLPPTIPSNLQIVVIGPDALARSYPAPHLQSRLIIGRSDTAQIRVQDPRVSRIHLLVTTSSLDKVYVTDLNSANGTYRVSERLPANVPVLWSPGELLSVGSFGLMLRHETK